MNMHKNKDRKQEKKKKMFSFNNTTNLIQIRENYFGKTNPYDPAIMSEYSRY